MHGLVSLLLMLIGLACTVMFLTFTHTTVGRRTELRVGLIQPWLTRTNTGGKVTFTTNPTSVSALAGAGAVLSFVAQTIARRRRPEPPDDEPPPSKPEPENTPIDERPR